MALNASQEAFAVAVVENGGDMVAAYKAAGYSMNMSSAAISVQADKLYHHPKISLRIKELQEVASAVAEKAFSISVEQRLRWLNEIVEAGLETKIRYVGEAAIEQRENLNAANAAIKTMNEMLGTGSEDEDAPSVNITFEVREAARDIRVTKGGSDAD